MKTLLTLLLFVIVNSTFAQSDPMPIPLNSVWLMEWRNPFMPWLVGTNAYRINGTVTVNDTTYYQIEYFDYCEGKTSVGSSGLIREEAGKWYYRYNTEGSELSRYDFTLEVGESITLESCFEAFEDPFLLTVISIEEITMYDGSTRRMWTLEYDETSEMAQNIEVWIEGIGNVSTGPFQPLSMTCIDLDQWLRCFLEDDQKIFPTQDFLEGTDCCNILSVTELPQASFIRLFPNPTSNELIIESDSQMAHITISDLSGRLIHSVNPMSNFIQLTTTPLPAGVYILTATSENGVVEKQKFIKE